MHGVEHATVGMIVLLVLLLAPCVYFLFISKAGKELFVRRIPGVDAIDEAIGRAAEMGRPMSFSTGLTSISPVLYACLGVLFYVARRSARYKSKLLIPQNVPEVVAIVEDFMRDAYRVEGRSQYFDSTDVRFLSDEQFAFTSGYIGMIQRENVASAFLFGYFAAESLIMAEAGQQIGAMQVAGSISPEQVPFFICTCDYTLIGEELYAASAYLTKEPVQLSSLYGQDRAKLVFLILIVIGVLIATINSIYPDTFMHNIDYYITASL